MRTINPTSNSVDSNSEIPVMNTIAAAPNEYALALVAKKKE
jgi:hypothetical protein